MAPTRLVEISEVVTSSGAGRSRAWNFRVHIDDATLRPDDPDGLIEDVRWFERVAAIEELQRLPYEPLRAPAIAYLRDDASTKSWHFTV